MHCTVLLHKPVNLSLSFRYKASVDHFASALRSSEIAYVCISRSNLTASVSFKLSKWDGLAKTVLTQLDFNRYFNRQNIKPTCVLPLFDARALSFVSDCFKIPQIFILFSEIKLKFKLVMKGDYIGCSREANAYSNVFSSKEDWPFVCLPCGLILHLIGQYTILERYSHLICIGRL